MYGVAGNEDPIHQWQVECWQPLACGSGAIVKMLLMVNWIQILMVGNALAGGISQAFDRLKEQYYKDKEIKWLSLSAIFAFGKRQ